MRITLIAIGMLAFAGTSFADDAKIQYARDVKPILASNCLLCHGPDAEERKANLRLDLFEEATKPLRRGRRAIVPGHPEKSELVKRIFDEGSRQMPPILSNLKLTAKQKETLKQWIAQGAKYEQHWAFVAPARPDIPETKNESWAKNPIDHFLLARLEEEGLKPAPQANRYALARRVSLDLIGLPPTIEQADRFVNDKSPNAYEKYVDEILRSPNFGERWAVVWLDLARYADSNGYANDNPRVIWRYRDWVIRALNRNMPFDQFTVEQIAGDLLPNPSKDQLLATAFHRNTPSNDEGGTSDEEFRVAAVVDRVNTTMQVWMGLTMACAQCHNHKYDPLSQEEYYEMFAIFNQTEDSDKPDNRPNLTIYTDKEKQQRVKLQQQIDELQQKLKDDKSPQKEIQKQIKSLQKQLSNIRGVPTPIMRELSSDRKRKTNILIRGNFLSKGKEVGPGVPDLFPPLPKDMPPNRLALAKWLVDPQNPLTARVAVNRFWEQIFGLGLVETSEDYGVRGKLPSHPELLDWLATEFVRQDWDMKKMLRLIVTSATYQQSSRITPDLLERDPDNRLYARGPRVRSSAETIRDQALFASGLLSNKMYGPPVRPPRPVFQLRAAFGGNTDWNTSLGEDKHRRALYTQWRRTTPYPSMITFDAPNRNVCTVRRPRTNTPLQALCTLNDPVFVEAAQALARDMIANGGKTVAERVTYGFRRALTRPPTTTELERLTALFQKAHAEFEKNPIDAQKLATDPIGALPMGMDSVDAAAWTVVGNVLLNLDEVFAKR